MQLDHWLVIAGGLAAIAWVNWYFFLAGRSAPAGAAAAGPVTILVKGGYVPGTVRVKAGTPVQLVFDRQETSSCSEEVVFPDFGIRRFLPAHQQTTVEIWVSQNQGPMKRRRSQRVHDGRSSES